MKLSKNFSLSEFTRSDKADELGVENEPSPEHLRNLTALALGLEQIRLLLGNAPIRITSGYRNPEVNAAVGGVPNSAHAKGWAADFTVKGISALEAAKEISLSEIAFDQVIYEKSRGVVHISFDSQLRQQSLTQHHGPRGETMIGIVP
jgi:putative chitinase